MGKETFFLVQVTIATKRGQLSLDVNSESGFLLECSISGCTSSLVTIAI